ncbi:hypothetical protein BH23CHL2_BH23CHL2_07900 [soil metagenome]
MTSYSAEELMHIIERVFVTKESTLEAEASGRSVEDLKQTTLVVRRMLRSVAIALPDSAYEEQPDDIDGNDVWSAGEIISHIAGATVRTSSMINEILDRDEIPPGDEITEITDVRVRGKVEALEALGAADRELVRILDSIPADVDTSLTIDHDLIGTVGVKGWLLFTAIHEGDHANQLRELDRSGANA